MHLGPSTSMWFLLVLVPILFGLYAQMKVSSAYRKNLQVSSRGRLTGAEAASAVMRSAGITGVEVVEIPGQLSDHYDPTEKRLALSSDNYRGTSLAALGVAAHEAGHAIQDKVGYKMMSLRQSLVPAVRFAAPISYTVIAFGFYLMSVGGNTILIQIGIAALAVMTLFQFVTLPVEFDASRRAKVQLVNLGILQRDEMEGVNETLNAAALTYVAAFVSSLGYLLYLMMSLSGNRRD